MRATAYDADEDLLLVADACGGGSRITAIEEGGFGATRWVTPPSAAGALYNGMSVMPGTGLLAVSCTSTGCVYIHSLATGERINSHPFTSPFFLAAARANAFMPGPPLLFVSGSFNGRRACDPLSTPIEQVNSGRNGEIGALFVNAAGETKAVPGSHPVTGFSCVVNVESSRPLAFIESGSSQSSAPSSPEPGPGIPLPGSSVLVAGAAGRSVLQIIAPGPGKPRVVHTHRLDGVQVMGLAADPSGTALIVCDRASRSVLVMPWPLPGMPALPPV